MPQFKNRVMIARFQGRATIDGLAEAVKYAPEEFLAHGNRKDLASGDDFGGRGNALATPKRREKGHIFNKTNHFGLEAEIFPRVLEYAELTNFNAGHDSTDDSTYHLFHAAADLYRCRALYSFFKE